MWLTQRDLPVLFSVANFSLGIPLPLLGLAGSQKCKLLGLLLQICCEKLATALHTSTDSASSSPRTGPQKISHWFPAGSSFVDVTKLMVLLQPVLPDSCRFFFFPDIVDVMTTASFYCLKFLCLRPYESEDLAGDRKQSRCIFCSSVRRWKSGPEV